MTMKVGIIFFSDTTERLGSSNRMKDRRWAERLDLVANVKPSLGKRFKDTLGNMVVLTTLIGF